LAVAVAAGDESVLDVLMPDDCSMNLVQFSFVSNQVLQVMVSLRTQQSINQSITQSTDDPARTRQDAVSSRIEAATNPYQVQLYYSTLFDL
jgi:GR25 family glycosyltransferase involved in LPS biosynthesis